MAIPGSHNRHSSSYGQTIAVEGDWLARSGFALPSGSARFARPFRADRKAS